MAATSDALTISDALEALIAAGKDTESDRKIALQAIQARPEQTAAYGFARAAVTGRVVQKLGAFAAAGMVREVERWAELSIKLDPKFRYGAASRMLGTLYVLAPSSLTEHGNSEAGLRMLEKLNETYPGVPENLLRLGEAYQSQGDNEAAATYLCQAKAKKTALRTDDQALLEHLLADAGNPRCP
jgi:tetratricopeptide (TPR) repeat protein